MHTDSLTDNSDTNHDSPIITQGYVYVMTHSIFSDVVKIGFTINEPHEYAEELSKKIPGHYTVSFYLQCDNPEHVENAVRGYIYAKACTNEFYEVPEKFAASLIKREALRIPAVTL